MLNKKGMSNTTIGQNLGLMRQSVSQGVKAEKTVMKVIKKSQFPSQKNGKKALQSQSSRTIS